MRIIILLLLFAMPLNAQNFKASFHGWWGDTSWIFHFKKNGRYSRESYGHFGNTKAEGRYKRKGNQIQILTGYKEDYGTVNEYYVIDTDSTLIDLDLGFDYRYTRRPDTLHRNISTHQSLKRRALAYLRTDTDGKSTDTLRYYGVADGYFFRQAEYNLVLFMEKSGIVSPGDEIKLPETSNLLAYSAVSERITPEDWKNYLDYLGNSITITLPLFDFWKATENSILLATRAWETQKTVLFEYAGTNIPVKITISDQKGQILETYTAIDP